MTLLISSALLLAGVFLFKKLWTGAAAGIIFLFASRYYKREGGLNLEVLTIDTVIIWIELALLLFGAYIFCFMLDDFKQWNAFRSKALSSNSRLTVILLFGWFLISFLEGLAGFGVPSMLVAPIVALNWTETIYLHCVIAVCKCNFGNVWCAGNSCENRSRN